MAGRRARAGESSVVPRERGGAGGGAERHGLAGEVEQRLGGREEALDGVGVGQGPHRGAALGP